MLSTLIMYAVLHYSIALFMFTSIIEPTVNVQEGLSSRNNGNFAFNFAYLQFCCNYAQLFFFFQIIIELLL